MQAIFVKKFREREASMKAVSLMTNGRRRSFFSFYIFSSNFISVTYCEFVTSKAELFADLLNELSCKLSALYLLDLLSIKFCCLNERFSTPSDFIGFKSEGLAEIVFYSEELSSLNGSTLLNGLRLVLSNVSLIFVAILVIFLSPTSLLP